MTWTMIASPIGALGVGIEETPVGEPVLVGLSFGRHRADPAAEPVAGNGRAAKAGNGRPAGAEAGAGLLAEVRAQLAAYFAGERTDFELPTAMRGGSEFDRAVWVQIAAIPFGETLSYGAVARAVGEPGGAQAVGAACNHNPLPIIVPCHRVIGADGTLVGFGGGLGRKRFLLQLEARIQIERTFAP